jgi:hypothetical protein
LLSAKRVRPGKSGEIEVTVRTEGVTTVSKSVNVTTNDPRQPLITLTVTGVVQPEFDLSERAIYFGSVPRGTEASKEVIITLPSGKSVTLLSATSTDPNVAVRLEPVPDSEGRKVKLVAVQKAGAKDGYHFGMIVIKTTSALSPELRISVRGMVTGSQSK